MQNKKTKNWGIFPGIPFIFFALAGLSVILTGVSILLRNHHGGITLTSTDWIGIGSLIVGVIAVAVGIWFGICQINTFRQEMKTLRNESIAPLRDSLKQSLISQFHEKEAMMHEYLSCQSFSLLSDETLERMLSDCRSALATKDCISRSWRDHTVTLLRRVKNRLTTESPTKESQIAELETIIMGWGDEKKEKDSQ